MTGGVWVLGTQDEDKRRLAAQLVGIDDSTEGGLIAYVQRAKQLLDASKKGQSMPSLRTQTCPFRLEPNGWLYPQCASR